MLSQKLKIFILFFLILFLIPENLCAMHIMEGFLPPVWCVIWAAGALPFLIIGLFQIGRKVKNNSKLKLLLGVAGAFAFVLSALKIPSVTGSCSHPTGIGLGAILFGPYVMSVLGCIVLIFQALLLAHGGITTLGANTLSLAVAGPLVAYGIYKLTDKVFKSPPWLAVFLGAFLGNLITYVTTSIQLALAFPSAPGGFSASLLKFSSIFAFTQMPLAVSEGILSVIICNLIFKYNREELLLLSVVKEEK